MVCDKSLHFSVMLKDKSKVVIIDDWCVVLFSILFSFNLGSYIVQFAKKCEMTSLFYDVTSR